MQEGDKRGRDGASKLGIIDGQRLGHGLAVKLAARCRSPRDRHRARAQTSLQRARSPAVAKGLGAVEYLCRGLGVLAVAEHDGRVVAG